MSLQWEGEDIDRSAAVKAAEDRARLAKRTVGLPLTIANEFSEIRVSHVETRNGARLLIESPKSGQWIALDPIELEAITWQTTQTFSAMIASPFEPMFPETKD
ncbi:hypothetical protein DM793_03730 [Paenarthrobacter nitroguajacolicus]|uniref:hypothetical protein n=1 Tax=Paenarthrobacter nitroguajacolicus TaxID=211146 RepID=UPI0015B96152|nr:hypothetical protein [Paenarthrobacter nitroguajacolicus]NWL10414.1 hypothetical protein [Paenarthrobacter nitroguajacolicus]